MPDRPNIIMICVDQWRGDCLSIDRHPTVHTPYLDRMALDGARFARAYAACPTCIPARAALFTGLGQRSHGRVGYQDGVPWDYPVTMAGEFTKGGYQTQAVGKMHVYPERSQLGFQNVILHDGYLHFARRRDRDYALVDDYTPWLRQQLGRDADYFEHGLNCNAVPARPWDKDEYLHPTNWVVHQSIDFLRRRDPRKPFFLFMSFHRPHPPFDPPAWAFDMYVNQPMPPRPVGDWADIFADKLDSDRPDATIAQIDPRILQRALAGYYGHMTHIDHQINRFVETLQDFGVHRNTYICFTSDHGEMLGDHHMFRKGYPYEGSARVPMILEGPPGSGIARNLRLSEPVELRDVMPTLLDCAGLEIPSSVEGKSFLPLAQGRKLSWRSHIHGEHTVLGQSLQWLTDGHEKYIWHSATGREQLFNLDRDPQELHDVARQPGTEKRLGYWRSLLIKELTGREEGYTDGQRLISGRTPRATLTRR